MTNYEKLMREVNDGLDLGQVEVKVVVTIREGGEILHRVTEHVYTGMYEAAGDLAMNAALKIMQGGLDVAD